MPSTIGFFSATGLRPRFRFRREDETRLSPRPTPRRVTKTAEDAEDAEKHFPMIAELCLLSALASRQASDAKHYRLFLGHRASTTVPIPPRGRNSPFTTAHTSPRHQDRRGRGGRRETFSDDR